MRRHILLFFVVLGPLGLLGCSAGDAVDAAFALGKNLFDGEPDRTEIEATFQAAADLNPDYQGNPSPLVVRFYELKSPTAFNNAGFFDLYDNEAAALGDDLQDRDELEFNPGDVLAYERELKPETRWVGVMGAYRDIENAGWRASTEVVEGKKTEMIIVIGHLEITIESE